MIEKGFIAFYCVLLCFIVIATAVLLCFIVTQDVTLIYNFINSIIAPIIMKFNRFIKKHSRFVH